MQLVPYPSPVSCFSFCSVHTAYCGVLALTLYSDSFEDDIEEAVAGTVAASEERESLVGAAGKRKRKKRSGSVRLNRKIAVQQGIVDMCKAKGLDLQGEQPGDPPRLTAPVPRCCLLSRQDAGSALGPCLSPALPLCPRCPPRANYRPWQPGPARPPRAATTKPATAGRPKG